MLKRLNQEEKENIKGRYGEHPLYLMIRRTCKRFESRMPVFRLSPEEIFLRVSMIMDDIKESPEKTDNLYDTIWDDLYCEYRDLGNDIPPETELELGVCLVITVLACCLGRSKSLLSNYTIAKLMEQAHNHYPGASEILDLFSATMIVIIMYGKADILIVTVIYPTISTICSLRGNNKTKRAKPRKLPKTD